MNIILPLVLVVAVLLLIIFYLIFSKEGGRKSKGLREREPARRIPPRTPSPPAIPAAQPARAASSSTAPPEELPPKHETPSILNPELVRQRLNDGYDLLFAAGGGTPRPPFKLRAIEEIDPNVLKKATDKINTLKNFDAMNRMMAALGDPDVSMTQLSKLVLTDPVISGKILQMANSSFYGLKQRVDSISHALMILGLANFRSILYHEGLMSTLGAKGMDKTSTKVLWKHATFTSICASYLHELFAGLDRGTLFTAGLLHDVGKYVMLTFPALQTSAELAGLFSNGIPLEEEDSLFGINHAVVGKLTLDHWRLSEQMATAVEMHHAPACIPLELCGLEEQQLRYVIAVFLANQLAKMVVQTDNYASVEPLDVSYQPYVDSGKLLKIINDSTFITQICQADALVENYL